MYRQPGESSSFTCPPESVVLQNGQQLQLSESVQLTPINGVLLVSLFSLSTRLNGTIFSCILRLQALRFLIIIEGI